MDDVFRRVVTALQTGNARDAERLLKKLLSAHPRHVGGLNLYSVLLTQLGRFEEAERYVKLALRENATSDATLYNYGIILKALRRPAEAWEQFSRALATNPSVADTWNNRGTVLNDLARYEEAIADFEKALSLNASYAEAACNMGNSLAALKQHDKALAAYGLALRLKPNFAEAWLGRGVILAERKQHGDALAAYEQALRYNDRLAEAWNNRGTVLADLARYEEAVASFHKALSLKHNYPAAHSNKGGCFLATKMYEQALDAYNKALALKPDFADGWAGRGSVFTQLKRYNDAVAAYDKAFSYDPDLKYLTGGRLHAKSHLCDWTTWDRDVEALRLATRQGKLASHPFALLAAAPSPADQFVGARRFVEDQPAFPAVWRGDIYDHDRIRIAYLSPDLSDHPVAQQAVGLFEQHDRSRFEVTALSIGPPSDSDLGRRVKASFERFVDARLQSDEDIAARIRGLEIDIVIDLCGYTQGSRPSVLARRPAPIQVNFLGYAATMGANHIDYIVADQTVVPRNHLEFFTERVAWLPDTFMINDSQRAVAERTPTRAECGLPETGFVFCSFNNAFKISPDVFRVWMRLLKVVDYSVLWLAQADPTAVTNLCREAEAAGVSPQRLIFAPRVPTMADHLARYQRADLFLDTLPYNGHVTASDALWAGVPVLTCLGPAFAGRVAASQLKAIGLSELIADSLESYEALALELAGNPCRLSAIKEELVRNRSRSPLFDTKRFTRHIESAYMTMRERFRRQETPQSFAVEPID